ncbi:MAG: hypothetical protein F6K30_27405 [Cyanothece sp. SIO2G6]|nr:hypothetical protein [Cyanothece sp. SIO2G6]
MSNIVASFTRLCESYIDLAERFQRLDIEHMTLKEKLVPLLKTLRSDRQEISRLQDEKQSLENELYKAREACNVLVAEKIALKALEPLLSEKVIRLLNEAGEQMELVNETINEIEANDQPNLGAEDKALLDHFYADPDAFTNAHELLTVLQPVEGVNGKPGQGSWGASSESAIA